MKHTKTPWSIGYNDGKIVDIVSSQGGVIAAFKVEELGHTQKLNAEFIVHAVNMHELLLATLKQAVESLDEFGCEDIVYYKDIIKKAGRK